MSTSNAERFLNAFNTIEKELQAQRRGRGYNGFRHLVRQEAATNPAVRRFQHDLEQLAELRNAIVHNAYADGRPIADPREDVVELTERIAGILQDPPLVYPMFKADVAKVDGADPVSAAIDVIHRGRYSQVPVLEEGRFSALLTANTIVHWLGERAEDGLADLDTPVRDVLRHAEHRDNVAFLGLTATVFEIVERFNSFERRGVRLDAILITRSGKDAERIVGIVTVADLPKAMRAISE